MVAPSEVRDAFIKEACRRVGRMKEVLLSIIEQGATGRFPALSRMVAVFKSNLGTENSELMADEIAQAMFFNGIPTHGNMHHGNSMGGIFSWLDTGLESIEKIMAEPFPHDIDIHDFLHLYEQFLTAYNPGRRKRKGVYYTPEPVASFMIRGVDALLKGRFGIKDGIAGEPVKLVDPAMGTGMFLKAACKRLIENDPEGAWKHITTHFTGSDIMISPMSIAMHQVLQMWDDYGIPVDERETISMRLMNSLKQDSIQDDGSFVLNEGDTLVIIGNPPYSVSSANKFEGIHELMVDYKTGLNERNIQPLSDDYIKFFRYAQARIDARGKGIVAFVTNNAFLYKSIHRRMRESLFSSFDRIYVLDLHGNSNIGEKTPEGTPDGNIFGIRVGASIIFLVKEGRESTGGKVFHSEKYGSRQEKLEYLTALDFKDIQFNRVTPKHPHFFFIDFDFTHEDEYNSFVKLNDIFNEYIIGVKTHRDGFIVEFNKERLVIKLKELLDKSISHDEIKNKYKLKESHQTIEQYRKQLWADGFDENLVIPYDYRVFDRRFTYYYKPIITRHRTSVMKHMKEENIALVTTKLISSDDFSHCFVSERVGDIGLLSSRTSESAYFFPLYIYMKNGERIVNIKADFLDRIAKKMEGTRENPEKILHYIYGILHSATFINKFKNYFSIDFPRIPEVKNKELMKKICELGKKLMELHLLHFSRDRGNSSNSNADLGTFERTLHLPEKQEVVINDSFSLNNVPKTIWEYKIGSYQVLKKWLKSRRGLKITNELKQELEKILIAIRESRRIQASIDELMAF
ncbi:MAG: type ISP restriction/modification enzyme [Promethearchaeota archaeon]